ncbi:Two-component hybrid sensor and regulator [plant metagenome]|uniref:Virulence sensor protein BvgS n=2 Tax=root TaxID=1 RepID=A0A1C3K2N7_9BURK|nr:ATP-binding protein [Orrella dioscoreae]SBT25675.1 Two-component hybrid sensor and regulator [Orrella dioscoreae]SOE52162.1 Two-component hybrid sensor and regulator [Orrella dioscoreae]
MDTPTPQRIAKVRRDYNTWVADETLEDYALRFTPHAFRKWSLFRVANTAGGAVSFLALEAIGGALVLNYGFINAFWSIIAVAAAVFLTGLPIAYYAAKHGLDMDLLTRGAGFGYLGSTLTSLIYASFTFIFFALEAAIMALALELATGLPLSVGYLVSALVILPLVTYGITVINRLHNWTQPVWLLMLVTPYAFILVQEPQALTSLFSFAGLTGKGAEFDVLLFGAGAAVAASLITQIGEQVDFLRFLPARTRENRWRWWAALLSAGPGWIVPGALKMLGGAFLAYLALGHGVSAEKAVDPTQMYLVAYRYVLDNPAWALAAMAVFVVISQVKINVTNAYAGSLAWSNFFARLTHSHPGRVVWLVFNVMIAVGLMELGVFDALEHVLGIFSHVAVAWIGALVADLVLNKPLGLSPATIEFRRAYLYDVNPVGVGGMLIALCGSLLAYAGAFGPLAQALSCFIALALAFIATPAIAWWTGGRYYLARKPGPALVAEHGAHAMHARQCVICANTFEAPDMAHCPAYSGPICSLCCTLDARCHDRCKSGSRLQDQIGAALRRVLPAHAPPLFHSRLAHYLLALGVIAGLLAAILGLLYFQEAASPTHTGSDIATLRAAFVKLFAAMLLVGGVAAWWLVLTNESRQVAQEESDRQTHLLLREIAAHEETDAQLQRAKEAAESANLAKSRFMSGMSHELRAPLNSILGYAQILERDPGLPSNRRDAVDVIHRNGKHLIGLIDGLLDVARIEAGKLRLENTEFRLPAFLDQIAMMFRPQLMLKGLAFQYEPAENLPDVVHMDEKRLRQILINLLGNAVKFTQRGHVAFRVRYASDMAQFEIEDSGAGIPADDLERIFLPFERSWAGLEQSDTGSGLGLTICRMLTGIMGGELTVRSHVGQGSIFTLKLFLPAVRAPRGGLLPRGHILGYAGRPRHILVIDDQASQRQVARDMLAPLGFTVHEAGNGAAGLQAQRDIQPDLILLDISMPDMSGWEVCRKLREQGASCRIVMASAKAYARHSPDGGEDAHDDFLSKPLILGELLATLGRLLRLDWHESDAQPVQPLSSQALHDTALDRADAEALLELGALGYVKGILQRLDDLRTRRPDAAPLIDHLHALAVGFQLGEYQETLKQHLHHHAPGTIPT